MWGERGVPVFAPLTDRLLCVDGAEVDLYADKPIAAQGASTDYHSDNSEEDSVVEGGGAEDTGAVSSLCQRLMQWLFGRLKHRKAS